MWSSVWQKLCEYARRMTDLQSTGLALRRLQNFFFLVIMLNLVILVNHKPLGKVRNLSNSLLGASVLLVFSTGSTCILS